MFVQDVEPRLVTSPYLFWVPFLVKSFHVIVKSELIEDKRISILRNKWESEIGEHEKYLFSLDLEKLSTVIRTLLHI